MLRFLAPFFFFLTGIASAEPIALGDGETLRFRVGWGIFTGAGEITIAAHAEADQGLPALRVITTTATRGLVHGVYPLEADADSLFDGHDGRILAAKASSTAGKRRTRSMAVFDYPEKTVKYVDYLNPQRSGTFPLPAGQPMDLITSLVQTRAWNMKPGDRRPAVVMFDNEFYDLTIVADHYERVRTPWGEVQTLVLSPIMEQNPKGMFRKGGRVRVWISQDEKRLPVKFEVTLSFGTTTASLVEHRPPSRDGAVAANANPRP